MSASIHDSVRPQIGEQELEALRYVADHAPITLRDVIDGFGGPRGLARTTVLTMLDRLRRKGYLERRKEIGESGRKEGVYVYVPAVSKNSLMADIVRSFVDKTLGGSLTPLVAYLVDSKGLSRDEAEALRKMIEG